MNKMNLGIMFRREHAPETLPDFARRSEATGFDELWVVEDCFYTSGIASAATALAVTKSITVGLGIMPAVVRNPVFAAMEIATLARLYPGRFLPGFGHGVAEWMHQVGAFPKSQLNALEEVTVVVRELLAGKRVTFNGRHIQVERARLVHPPEQIPPISLGVIGPKSLSLSGRVADGTILSEYSSPAYVAWAKEQISTEAMKNTRSSPHRLTIFAFAHADSNTAHARQTMRAMVVEAIASGGIDVKLAAMGILEQVRAYREHGGQPEIEASMPAEWIDDLTIVGTREDWQAAIKRYTALGADSLVLVPHPDAGFDEIERFAENLF